MTHRTLRASSALLTLALGLAPLSTAQAQSKRIYIAVDDHTDYMWSADEETYRKAFLDTLDYYLNLADQTASEPSEYQSRFNTDGSFWMWTYEKNRTSAQFDRLISRIRSGHISVPLNALSLTFGGTPTEAILRGMYYPGRIERKYNLRFPIALSMENQVLPLGLASLFSGSGAKYSWRGICACATQVPGAAFRDHEIYRWTGLDGQSLLMKWNSMINYSNQSIGGYAEARNPAEVIDFVDNSSTFKALYPYNVIGAFGKGWDDIQTMTDEFVTVAKAKTTSSRKIIVSNEIDFFQDFEATHGAALPTEAYTYGNEWDTYCASMAELTGKVRRTVEKLRGAEALATLVSLATPTFMDGRTEAREKAFIDLGLYWEHDWNADGPISKDARRDWQRRIANEIVSYVDTLHTDAASAFGGLIQKSGTNTRFYAFNPLSWARDDYADISWTDTNPVHVIDLATGQETPSQIVTVNGQRKLRVQASQIPAVGYKVFEIRAGAGATFSNAATVSGSNTVLENEYYKLTVATNGAITSLIDKLRGNAELAKTVNSRSINDLGSGSGSIAVENAGPVTVTLKVTASSPLAHTTRVTLLRGSDRIDLTNEITQNFTDVRTWGFGFNLTGPDVWHEELGAVIRAKLTSQGGHYATKNARYDWLTLGHFADMSNGAGTLGVTLSAADTPFMKLGSSTASTFDTTTAQISVLAGGQVDGTHLGIPNQGGDTYFLQRFGLRSHAAFDAAASMRFSLEHQNPLVTGLATGGTVYPETSYSAVSISNPNVLLWALKPAEEGIDKGVVARVWNLSNAAATFTLGIPDATVLSAKRTSHIETPEGDATVSGGRLEASAAAQQLLTFLVQPDMDGAAGDDDDTTSPGDDDTPAGDDDTTSPGDGTDGTDDTTDGRGCGSSARFHLGGWLSGSAGDPAGRNGVAAVSFLGLAMLAVLRRRL